MAAPKFRELFICKLTTPTTCYSASSEVSSVEPLLVHLATENHTLEINLDGTRTTAPPGLPIDDHLSFVEHSIPIPSGIPRRIAKKLICVGYCEKDGWEAIVLLDTSKSQENSADHSLAQQQQQDDERTTTTAEGRQQMRRRVSSGGGSVSSSNTTDGTASLSSLSTSASAPTATVVVSTTTTTTTTTSDNNTTNRAGLTKLEEEEEGHEEEEEDQVQPLARLVLQHHQSRRRFTKALDFRPLSPCVAILKKDYCSSTTSSDGEAVVGIWVGSSDDSKLRLFRNDTTTETLVEVPLDARSTNNAATQDKDNTTTTTTTTSFQTPVMAVACLMMSGSRQEDNNMSRSVEEEEEERTDESRKQNNTNSNNVVAVACQDGTLRFIGFDWLEDSTLQCRMEYTVVVDGPIVCIHLVTKTDDTMEAVIGSLCGYVARFVKTSIGSSGGQQWEGPYMVAEGFGYNHQSQEDSVLAVHSWEDKVALGTYSGRCLLYGQVGSKDDNNKDNGDENNWPIWDCQLLDPIHGICHLPPSATTITKTTTLSLITLLVTTSRSIHIFQEVPKVYDPAKAKHKLELLLSQQQQQAKTTSSTAPKPTTEVNNHQEIEEGKEESGASVSPRVSLSLTAEPPESSSQVATPEGHGTYIYNL